MPLEICWEYAEHWKHLAGIQKRRENCRGGRDLEQQHRSGNSQLKAGQTRRQGWNEGVLQRLRRPLSSVIHVNSQSLRNKIDELQAGVTFSPEFRNIFVIVLTETWLTAEDQNQD
ncbi:hypothetical protein AMECASPLE_034184 [Ameca splendens]|uniref:Uncharacterized protein n=1 Tax=Ameca splendens TaxID=208324 RepID=A0ABV0Z5Y6_9TELE